ncbi:MAG: hypothetical protein R3D68_12580 [Hyphomicrobiaceae bacterium]
MRFLAVSSVLLAISAGTALGQAKVVPMERQTFSNPRIGGLAIDRCLTWGQQCNGEAAQRFCQLQGYQTAENWRWSFMKPTRILGSPNAQQICNLPAANACGGITQVTCVRPKWASGQQPPRPTPPAPQVARISAQLERVDKCQYRSGGHPSQRSHYVCRVHYSLSNTGNTSVVYNFGKAVTLHPWIRGRVEQGGIGYPTAHLPGRKMMLGSDCIIPHGLSNGSLHLEGAGKDANGKPYSWRLAVRCPAQ